MNGTWSTVRVGDCIDRSYRPTGRTISKSEYAQEGQYPVVDQGAQPVAGWTDDQSALVTNGLPVILFGDHTRALKFLESPFARGADGTQIIQAADGVDAQFLYYACRALDLPSRGYNRHFTQLRESMLQVPDSVEEQKQIGAVLRVLDERIALAERRAQLTREVFTSLLYGMTSAASRVADLDLSALVDIQAALAGDEA